MADKLKFDLDSLSRFEKSIDNCITELSDINAQVQEQMAKLQLDWQTPRGRQFFAEEKTDWTEQVENYISILKTLKEMIQYAQVEYGNVKATAEGIQII